MARQVWAISLFACPAGGFDEVSLFSSIHYLLITIKSSFVPLETRRMFPWLFWFMWKNRNGLFFEGKLYLATERVSEAREEAELCFSLRMYKRIVSFVLIWERQLLKKMEVASLSLVKV